MKILLVPNSNLVLCNKTMIVNYFTNQDVNSKYNNTSKMCLFNVIF